MISTPKKKPRSTSRSAALLGVLLVAIVALSACTPEEVSAFNKVTKSKLTVDQAKQHCVTIEKAHGAKSCKKVALAAMRSHAPKPPVPQPVALPGGAPSDAALARLAKCESSGNPRARSKSGKYTGLYQFDRKTWNGIARQVLPTYVGVTPGDAPAHIQDAMARVLYRQRGRNPWPHCGRYI